MKNKITHHKIDEMRYITYHKYVNLETGEILEESEKPIQTITIIKRTKKINYVNYSTRTVEVTNYFRVTKYREQEIQFGTNQTT